MCACKSDQSLSDIASGRADCRQGYAYHTCATTRRLEQAGGHPILNVAAARMLLSCQLCNVGLHTPINHMDNMQIGAQVFRHACSKVDCAVCRFRTVRAYENSHLPLLNGLRTLSIRDFPSAETPK
jgi:hypothetical protein